MRSGCSSSTRRSRRCRSSSRTSGRFTFRRRSSDSGAATSRTPRPARATTSSAVEEDHRDPPSGAPIDRAPQPRALIDRKPIGAEAQRRRCSSSPSRCSPATGASRRRALCCVASRRGSRRRTRTDLVEATLDARPRRFCRCKGPPGTGKTYRGARMIVAALRAGKRVGMTAPSHAAIQNLLAAVELHAREIGVDLQRRLQGRGLQRTTLDIAETDSNDGVGMSHQLVAGTAWLFARHEHREGFDLVFVDEAGQFALANAAAVGRRRRQPRASRRPPAAPAGHAGRPSGRIGTVSPRAPTRGEHHRARTRSPAHRDLAHASKGLRVRLGAKLRLAAARSSRLRGAP